MVKCCECLIGLMLFMGKILDFCKHENSVDKRYFHPNKQYLGHLSEQKAFCGFFI